MKSIVLIIPYFGRLPDFFPVWKETALANPTVDFMFFTDIDGLRGEGNIRVVHISFSDFREKLQERLDFQISLNKPYKVCDFRPAFGYALSEYIVNYDFWGYCDIDLIFGDIRKFITDVVLEKNQKILEHGHFTLYRNDPETNKVFMRCPGYGDYDYRKAFTSDESMYFDEFLGTQLIFRKEKVPTYYNLDSFFQVASGNKCFSDPHWGKDRVVFQHSGGRLFVLRRREGRIEREEILYAHFLKRKINVRGYIPGSGFYVVPNRVESGDGEPDLRWFGRQNEGVYRLERKVLHMREYLHRYAAGDYGSFMAYRKERKRFREDLARSKEMIRSYGEDK